MGLSTKHRLMSSTSAVHGPGRRYSVEGGHLCSASKRIEYASCMSSEVAQKDKEIASVFYNGPHWLMPIHGIQHLRWHILLPVKVRSGSPLSATRLADLSLGVVGVSGATLPHLDTTAGSSPGLKRRPCDFATAKSPCAALGRVSRPRSLQPSFNGRELEPIHPV